VEPSNPRETIVKRVDGLRCWCGSEADGLGGCASILIVLLRISGGKNREVYGL